MSILKSWGSFLSNIFYDNHILDWRIPSSIGLHITNKVLTIPKRNHYLIGGDTISIPFSNIRRVGF